MAEVCKKKKKDTYCEVVNVYILKWQKKPKWQNKAHKCLCSQCPSMESVFSCWLQTYVSSLHFFCLLFLDLVVSLSFCCDNLIVVVTDQLFWSLYKAKQEVQYSSYSIKREYALFIALNGIQIIYST